MKLNFFQGDSISIVQWPNLRVNQFPPTWSSHILSLKSYHCIQTKISRPMLIMLTSSPGNDSDLISVVGLVDIHPRLDNTGDLFNYSNHSTEFLYLHREFFLNLIC
jgi:hypothetical protein